MNFFKQMAQAVVGFFKSDIAKKIAKLGLEILGCVVGDASTKLYQIAREEVAKAEDAGVSDKYAYAFKNIVTRVRNDQFAESEINLAIELSLAALKKELSG